MLSPLTVQFPGAGGFVPNNRSPILLAVLSISIAQMKLINGTPLVIVPAPGAGFLLDVVDYTAQGTIVNNGGTPNTLGVRYKTSATVVIAANSFLTATPGYRMTKTAPSAINTVGTDYSNQALEVFGSANAGAAYNGTCRISLTYRIVPSV